MQEIIDSLSDFGLSKKEALAYVTLLKIGKSNIKKIATKSGLKRPTCYVVLDELRKKGFILQIPISNKVVYEARDPSEIKEIITDKYEKFKDTYLILESIKADKEGFNTFYYEGMSGLKNAYEYKRSSMKGQEIIGFGAKIDNISKESHELLSDVARKIIQDDISIKAITVNHSSIVQYKKLHPEIYDNVRILPSDVYNSDVSIEACNDFTRIIDIQENKAVIIESKKLSDAIKQIYKLVEKGLDK